MNIFKKTLVIYDNGWKFKFKERKAEPVTIEGNEIIAWILVIALASKVVFGY